MNHQTEIARQQVARKLEQIKGWRQVKAGETVKRCACCGQSYKLKDWRQLPNHGLSQLPDDGGPPWIEFRACPCGSTIAIELDRKKKPIIKTKNYLRTLTELGRLAENNGYVRIPESKIWGARIVSAKVLLDMRGTELEMLFTLGIEVV